MTSGKPQDSTEHNNRKDNPLQEKGFAKISLNKWSSLSLSQKAGFRIPMDWKRKL